MIIEKGQESFEQIMGLLQSSNQVKERKSQTVLNQLNMSRSDCFNHQIDYAFEFEAKEIAVAILKENKKHKIQWKFLPLCLLEVLDIKIATNIETIVTQRNQHKLGVMYGKEKLELPVIAETKTLSKKAEFSSMCTLHYFSFRLNFYEPFIEKFLLLASYKSDEESKSVSIDIDESFPLNINLSTALFENIAVCTTYLNETMVKHGLKSELKTDSLTKTSLLNLESNRNNYDYNYSIENLIGEEIQVATTETDEFVSVYANQVMMLDFTNNYEDLAQTNMISDGSKSSKNISNNILEGNFNIRSPYRKENFRIESSLDERTKKVYLFIPSLSGEISPDYEELEE